MATGGVIVGAGIFVSSEACIMALVASTIGDTTATCVVDDGM